MSFRLAVFNDQISMHFDTAIRETKRHGFTGLEIRSVWFKPAPVLNDRNIDRINLLYPQAGLTICSIASPIFKCDIDNDEECERHFEMLDTCLDLARRLDAPLIRGFGFLDNGDFERSYPRIVEAYRRALSLVEKAGKKMAVQNKCTTYMCNAGRLARLLKDIDSPLLGAMWDPCNNLYGEDPEVPYPDGYNLIKDRIVHVHIRNARKLESGKIISTPVDEGDVDVEGQVRALKDDGYEGWLSLKSNWGICMGNLNKMISKM